MLMGVNHRVCLSHIYTRVAGQAGWLTGKGRPASVELWVFSVTMLNGKFLVFLLLFLFLIVRSLSTAERTTHMVELGNWYYQKERRRGGLD